MRQIDQFGFICCLLWRSWLTRIVLGAYCILNAERVCKPCLAIKLRNAT
jgi:hypothetical protein